MPSLEIELSNILVKDRFRKDYGDIQDLADSITKYGLMQNLVVKDQGDTTPRYRLIAGGRRYAALAILGRTHAQSSIYPETTSDIDAVAMELEENIKRKNLDWAEDMANLLELDNLKRKSIPGWKISDTATLIGASEATVSRDLELAREMEVPEVHAVLSKAKTKSEAVATLKRLHDEVVNKELVRRVKASAPEVPKFENYIVQDFFDVAPHLESESVDCIELDPPWGVALDEQTDRQCELDKQTRSTERFVDWKVEQYLEKMKELAKISYRVLRDDRWLLLWGGITHYEANKQIMLEAGFRFVEPPCIWVKPGDAPVMPAKGYTGLISGYEVLFYMAKGHPRINHPRSNVFIESANTPERFHPTEKPKELLKLVLNSFLQPTQNLLVPFAGSGNTLAAAHELGIHSFGYDLSSTYRDAYVARMIRRAMTGKESS